jgi:hypothetical protein
VNRYKAEACSMDLEGGGCGCVCLCMCFCSSRKVSCCSLQIEMYCWKSVMLVTTLSSRHFIVAPILSRQDD